MICATCSRMRSKGSRFHSGDVGVELCSLDVAFVAATVRNRSQPWCQFRGQAWRVVTCHEKSTEALHEPSILQ